MKKFSCLAPAILITLSVFAVEVISPTITLVVNGRPVVEPSSKSVISGSQVSFSVTPTGTAPTGGYLFDWRKGVASLGVTTQTLTLSSVTVGDSGTYTCIVTNIAGPIESQATTLTVEEELTITQQPIPANVAVGQPFTLMSSATGPATINYQWQKLGPSAEGEGEGESFQDIVGATGQNYYKASAESSDDGSYQVIVNCTSASGYQEKTSNIVVVTVTEVPVYPTLNLVYSTGTNQITATFDAKGYTYTVLIGGTKTWETALLNRIGLQLMKETAPTDTRADGACSPAPIVASTSSSSTITNDVLTGFVGKLAPYLVKDTGIPRYPNTSILLVYLTKDGVGPAPLTKSDGVYYDLNLQ